MRGALGFALTAAVMAGGLVGGRMMMPPTLAAAEPPAVVSASFDAMMAQSMTRMHDDMMVPPSGDPDRDFAAMMIPHHDGAIAMAQAELLYGKDPVLRRLAQGIIVEQGQEIAVMRRALADLPPAPESSAAATHLHHHGTAPAAEMPSEICR
ncbi:MULTISPECIES: CopM family metallochaperone [Methylobacteriaceae]|jgi:hypothetical protein|uniref:DUF305 domain-containing protein n=2 Tax=Methylobacteriaceae TaxID=119045 RepID=C5AYI2_METEA|nr:MULTISPECIES: DUF305 domain-containing protein [Methylobacteriaceae]ACS39098.1 Hypothetical protein MexAM1_META1p1234 [Methylorubrum extorquens AM1]KQT71506.1 hypothetical protein ASG51_11315 [Methylobacterium sp. Leaf465]MCE4226340.1 DUF305 domain-containing protein [Methylobacterium sp. C25]MCP1542796.1 hypothetical protein [Methylorubrum extorquens]MCP1589859.1 hypothetical protein [Methylorubrum extorquens]